MLSLLLPPWYNKLSGRRAYDKFPKEPTISYNLSCYACQMQQMEAALVWFKRAAVIGGKEKMKQMALDDPDLEALWEEIKTL